jgi:ribosomal protein L11 methyltransferase
MSMEAAAISTMPWLQLETELGQQHPESLEPLLEELGAVAIWFRDAGDEPVLEPAPGETPGWSSTIVAALFPDGTEAEHVTAALRGVIDGDRLNFSTVTDRDWQAEWQGTLQPLRFGERLWVVPEGTVQPEPGIGVALTPGMAFGTGEHPTTAMCLKWLDSERLAGTTVLDYGCGSGLLAIAALALGADHAQAVDIDPQALVATRSNGFTNGCGEKLSVSDPEEIGTTRQYDVLVANILSGILLELGPEIRDLMRPGARLALSGILAEQAAQVCADWSGWAQLAVTDRSDDWVLLTGRKHGL